MKRGGRAWRGPFVMSHGACGRSRVIGSLRRGWLGVLQPQARLPRRGIGAGDVPAEREGSPGLNPLTRMGRPRTIRGRPCPCSRDAGSGDQIARGDLTKLPVAAYSTDAWTCPLSCRPKCSFRPLSVRKRRRFSSPMLNGGVVDCRTRLCIGRSPSQPVAVFPMIAARSAQL